MIVDSFLFGWELDILEMRLHEMDCFVDKFVIIESDKTFQGSDKPFYFEMHKERFSQWSNKIVTVQADLPVTDSPWAREYASREALKKVLHTFPDNAIILHGDVDELMSQNLGKNLEYFIDDKSIYSLDQKLYSMAVDWLYPMDWDGTTVTRCKNLKSMSILDFRNARLSAKKIRDGWHFTWLGGPEFIERKAASFSHTEDEIQSYIKTMGGRLYSEGYHVRGEKLVPVDIDETFPQYLQERRCPDIWFRPR